MARVDDVLGCVPADSGSTYCLEHCPDPDNCEMEHGAIFRGSEWDCSPPSCDTCLEAIEGPTILHYGRPCEYCGSANQS
jgi:hypothetical protein